MINLLSRIPDDIMPLEDRFLIALSLEKDYPAPFGN
jgi:hypothetical protein